jgi:hypothetical protein
MNNEFEIIWKEMVVVEFTVLPAICLAGLRETTKTSDRIWPVSSPNATQESEILAYSFFP